MGIKFLCPQGHSLNVKTFLAGKRGVCPNCGVTFRIPSESMPNTRAEAIGASAENALETPRVSEPVSVQPAAGVVSRSNGQVAAHPQQAPAAPAQAAATPFPAPHSALPSGIPLPASGATPAPSPAAPAVVPVGVPVGAPAPYAMPARTPTAYDPISESPQAIWYIRPPSGGQYGPARGDVMRTWLVEGRVSGDSLVWREGWTDWRSAGQVFPQLAGASPAMSVTTVTPIGANQPAASPAAETPRSQRTAARYSAKKKSGSGVAIAALVGLVLVCVVLIGVLVVVLNR
ncbi:MAG: DUF4339 domain-containing protein [Pirellulaceae bacterium]|nr:DUF4339 domain-containing protein [Pirellulaceae bacterium]